MKRCRRWRQRPSRCRILSIREAKISVRDALALTKEKSEALQALEAKTKSLQDAVHSKSQDAALSEVRADGREEQNASLYEALELVHR